MSMTESPRPPLSNDDESKIGDDGVMSTDAASLSDEKVSIRSLISESAIYGIAKIIDPAIGFVLLPIMTAILMPSDYGLISLFTATSHVMFVACSLGVHQSFFRYFTEADRDDQREDVLNTSLTLALIYWLAVLPLGIFYARPISAYLFDVDSPALIYLLLVFSVVQTIDSIGCNLLQATGRAWSFLFNSVFATVAVRLIAVVLIIGGAGAWGWITGETVGRMAAMVLIVATAMPKFRLRMSKSQAKKLSWYGMMLVPAMLSYYVMTITDKYLIRMLTEQPFEQIGLYTVGERIAGIMHMANFALMIGWQRFAFKNMHAEGGESLIGYGWFMYLMSAGYMLLGLMLLGDDLTHWAISAKFDAGLKTILPLTLAAFAGGLANISDIGLHKRNLPHVISAVMTVAAVLNIAINFYAIPVYGISGAAWATFLCQTIRLVVILIASQWAYPVHLDYRRLTLVTILFSGAFVVGKLFDPLGWIASGLIQSVILVAVPVLLWWSPILTDDERGQVRGLVDKVFGKLRRHSA